MQSTNRFAGKAGRARKAFTIVELLMVIGIISVLITITVSAITGSLQRGRKQKARALCILVEQGMATYYAQEGKWPADALNNNDIDLNADENGNKSAENKVVYRLADEEVTKAVKELVKRTQDKKPVMDVSGLFVRNASANAKTGTDFLSAIRGTKKLPNGISLDKMEFGYPDPDTGYFQPFKVVYSPSADKVTVSMQ